MAIVTYSREAGTGLTPEELIMIEEAEKLPQVYDEDCPKLTPEQLAEFRPVHHPQPGSKGHATTADTVFA